MSAETAINDCYSYERFARQPFCQEVDRRLLARAPVVETLVDLGTGTGAIIEHLLELRRLSPPFRAIGIDVDVTSLKIAADKFAGAHGFWFVQAAAESLPLPGGFSSLVTFCNAVHLTDAARAFREAFRVLREGGTLLVNTAYEKAEAYPGSSARYWGTLVSLARRTLQSRHGWQGVPKPVDLMAHDKADFRGLAEAAGFEQVEIETYTTSMDREAMKAICAYAEFARGSLPSVPLELAIHVLTEAVDAVFERYKIACVPRNWMFLAARKPSASNG
jgi:ubiquinone/menaquinone biosynthesis C-methylase UbiE